MAQFGTVAGSSRDFVEYKGRRIENERRRVLFTSLKEKVSIPREMKLFGTIAYARLKGVDTADQDEKKGLFDGVPHPNDHMDPDLELLARQQKEAIKNNKHNKRFWKRQHGIEICMIAFIAVSCRTIGGKDGCFKFSYRRPVDFMWVMFMDRKSPLVIMWKKSISSI